MWYRFSFINISKRCLKGNQTKSICVLHLEFSSHSTVRTPTIVLHSMCFYDMGHAYIKLGVFTTCSEGTYDPSLTMLHGINNAKRADSLRGFSEPSWRPPEMKTHTAFPAVMFSAWSQLQCQPVLTYDHNEAYSNWKGQDFVCEKEEYCSTQQK